MTTLPSLPYEATKIILKNLPSKRMKDILERRFGLKGGRRQTLEAIGREYKITRERVRQIEADALKYLSRENHVRDVEPIHDALEGHLKKHGGVMAEHHLFTTLAEAKYHPHLSLLLGVGKRFRYIPENDAYHARWVLTAGNPLETENIVGALADRFAAAGNPVPRRELDAYVHEAIKKTNGPNPEAHMVDAYLATSKLIRQNPYGDFGLVSWASIKPRGVRDKAYGALAKAGKPLHFLEVTKAINEAGWNKRKAHPQTVHNELIKDKRFVLVGRGLYALREWGYEPGVVRDVLVSVIRSAGKPLTREEIITGVLEKRMVKTPTILLNLQNQGLFRRLEDGRYTLV